MMNQNDKAQKIGSGRDVEDYNLFCDGDIEPSLNKKIRSLIQSEKNYIVFIDDELTVQWSWNQAYGDSPIGFAEVASRVGHLETLAFTQLTGNQEELFERLLAEGMARLIGDKDKNTAIETLNKAEAYLSARGAENARVWYLVGSFSVAFLSIIIACLAWIFKGFITMQIGINALEVFLGACLGSSGALLSILYRSEEIPMEPTAGCKIHVIEGAARTLAGNFGALLLALAVKANVVLGIMKSDNYGLPALLITCLVAGASERFVRGIIRKMETPA